MVDIGQTVALIMSDFGIRNACYAKVQNAKMIRKIKPKDFVRLLTHLSSYVEDDPAVERKISLAKLRLLQPPSVRCNRRFCFGKPSEVYSTFASPLSWIP